MLILEETINEMFVRSWRSVRAGYSFCKYFSSQRPEPSSTEAVLLSDTCVQKLKQLCSGNVFLRLCVESGGCSGFQYKFDLDDKLADDDKYVTSFPSSFIIILLFSIALIFEF